MYLEHDEECFRSPIEECEKCREMLLEAIKTIPDSPHKRFKYAHYQNLVYRTMLGVDAKEYKARMNIKGDIIKSLCSWQLKKCCSLFLKVSMSIMAGDTFRETKEMLKGGE